MNVSLVETLHSEIAKRPDVYMVGIAGIPGSGKTTLSQALASRFPGAVVVPMDGYHIPRNRLDAEGLKRRGAPFTFDADAFRLDMEKLRDTRRGVFPAFDHAEKDPVPGVIYVSPEVPLVIIEGLYVLMKDWGVEPVFDLRVFLDCEPLETARRLTIRHVESGVAATEEEARQRVMTNDQVNAEFILADGCRERADLILWE
jgi:pantothenate kinase